MGMFGLLVIDKPAGPTSHDVVAGIRRRLGRRVKVGHAGTLDPFACGVLVICVGPATRLARYVQAQPKRYRATIALGADSTTDDPEGPISSVEDAAAPDEAALRGTLEQFVGTIQQIPPAHSAVHVDGRRAYKLARAGQSPQLAPRAVTVHSIGLLRYEYPDVEIEVACGTGTYIRAIARDVGQALGTGGYCRELTRTAIGDFRIANAVAPDDVDLPRHLLPPLTALGDLPKIAVGPEDAQRLGHGKRLHLPEPAAPGEVALVDAEDSLLAVGQVQPDGGIQPKMVFVATGP